MFGDPPDLDQTTEVWPMIVANVIGPLFGLGGVWNCHRKHLVKSGHQPRVWMYKFSAHRVVNDLLSQP
jgi:hypothetical protein